MSPRTSSSPRRPARVCATLSLRAPVAQWIEHLTSDQQALPSIRSLVVRFHARGAPSGPARNPAPCRQIGSQWQSVWQSGCPPWKQAKSLREIGSERRCTYGTLSRLRLDIPPALRRPRGFVDHRDGQLERLVRRPLLGARVCPCGHFWSEHDVPLDPPENPASRCPHLLFLQVRRGN